MYMDIPKGFEYEGTRKTHCLLLIKNLYGQKQAGRTWQLHLRKGLIDLGFEKSSVDECVFYRGSTILLTYVDDCILAGSSKEDIDKCIQDMSTSFRLTDEGDLSDYLGIKIAQLDDGRITLTQPHLIDSIIADLKFVANTKPKDIPSLSSCILQRDLEGEPFDEHWEYRSVIGKLNFLEKSTRPDLAYAVHQCARFSADPRKSHANAIWQIVRYLIGTRDRGIIMQPSGNDFEVAVDSDFAGNWNRDTAADDIMTAKSRSGHVVMYSGCPVLWSSKMQTEIALSTTESEYIACSNALRDVIPLMDFVDEIRQRFDSKIVSVPTVRCELFEDNSGALELATVHKMRPRTKHINVKYHHFREHVRTKRVLVRAIRSEENYSDTLTKPLPRDLFCRHRKKIQGW